MDPTSEFSSLIAAIYDAATDAELWPDALEATANFVGGSAAMIFWQDLRLGIGNRLSSWGDNPEFTGSYFEHYISHNPITPYQATCPVGKVVSASGFVDFDRMRCTQFYEEWMLPQGYVDNVFSILERSAHTNSSLAVSRSAREGLADVGAIARLALLVPHISRAVRISKLLDEGRDGVLAYRGVMNSFSSCIFMVNAEGLMVEANQAGAALLADRDLLALSRQRLVSRSSKNMALRTLLAACHPLRPIEVNRPFSHLFVGESGQSYVADWLPLHLSTRHGSRGPANASSAFVVRRCSLDTRSAVAGLSRLYDLTRREAEVLSGIMEIGNVPEVSEALKISRLTAKAHLQSIFSKTGTHRQADLVKLVASALPPIL